MRSFILLSVIFLCGCQSIPRFGARRMDTPPAKVRPVDKLRILEAYRMVSTLFDICGEEWKKDEKSPKITSIKKMKHSNCPQVWEKWLKPPYPILLVDDEYEFLLNHPRPDETFMTFYEDYDFGHVYFRKQRLAKNLVASYPAVSGITTIVIGRKENTSKKSSTAWSLTLLHEHIHQIQFEHPDYYKHLGKLRLYKKHKDSKWILNHPFPYNDLMTEKLMERLGNKLLAALSTKDKKLFYEYMDLKRGLTKLLNKDDLEYLKFQTWQEGIARYFEIIAAGLLKNRYKPSKEYQALPDYVPLEKIHKAHLKEIGILLRNPDLKTFKRVSFYAFGAAEGLALHNIHPHWSNFYFDYFFDLDALANQMEMFKFEQ